MTLCENWTAAALFAGAASAAPADAVFNIWFDAPEEVQAGEMFTMTVWGEVSGSVLDEGEGAFRGIAADLLASGVNVEFSAARFLLEGEGTGGTPEPNALRMIIGFNHPEMSFHFTDGNPLRLFVVDVFTNADDRGTLELVVAPPEGVPSSDAMLWWWVDYPSRLSIADDDPGSTRIVTPAIVNVIPVPASVALLALAGVGAARRRR